MRLNYLILILCFLPGEIVKASAQNESTGFTQSDRDRIIQTQTEIKDLRNEMNARFEAVDKRFDDINKRLDDVNKRIDRTNTYIGWLMAFFCAITAASIGFAVWDRRTMIRPFETKVREMERVMDELKNEKTARKIIGALRELANTDSKLAKILKTHHLL